MIKKGPGMAVYLNIEVHCPACRNVLEMLEIEVQEMAGPIADALIAWVRIVECWDGWGGKGVTSLNLPRSRTRFPSLTFSNEFGSSIPDVQPFVMKRISLVSTQPVHTNVLSYWRANGIVESTCRGRVGHDHLAWRFARLIVRSFATCMKLLLASLTNGIRNTSLQRRTFSLYFRRW